jgi:iron complex outermembrane receptor protein
MANKEPNRDDFEAGVTHQPRQEKLHDFEAAIEKRSATYSASATLYYMLYKDQLVLTGQLNDVGAATRINVPNSYRAGIELQGGYYFNKWLSIAANLAFSSNKIKAYTQYMDEYDANFEWTGTHSEDHRNTDIAFSPSVVGGATISILPVKNLEIALLSKYVSDQYLDNTQTDSKKLAAYYTQDLRAIWTLKNKFFKEWNIIGQVNNVFDKKYEPNGWTYPYIFDGTVTSDNGYFPMAGTNLMLSVNIKL